MPSAEQVRAVVDRYAASFDDKEAWVGLFADDAKFTDPVGAAPTHQGRDAIAGAWDLNHQLASRYVFDVKDVIVCGDEAIGQFTVTAHSDGGAIMIDVVDLFRVTDDGRVAELRAYWEPTRARPATGPLDLP
jgi:ketosteroid isomerase-like protein